MVKSEITSNTNSTTLPIDQVDYLLSQISDMAHSINRLAVNISGKNEDEAALSSAVSAMASQIEFLIELAQEKLGSTTHKADAIALLTSPAYLELETGVMQ